MTSDNLGVGALMIAHISILERIAQHAGVTPKFIVIGWKDTRSPYFSRDDLRIVELRGKDFLKPMGGLLAELRSCDIVLDIGAGDSFADIYGTKRTLAMICSKLLTLLARRPLVLSPQTMGPFEGQGYRRLVRAIAERSALVSTRDALSTAFLREIGYSGTIIEASDVALRLPYTPVPRGVGEDRIKVGLNVSGLLMNGGYTRSNMFGLRASYPELIDALIRAMTARGDVELHLVPHVISAGSEVEDDYRASEALAACHPGVRLAPRFNDPVEAKSYISGMDFFAGARMHACIAAFSSGVPVLPMAYSRKFAGLFDLIGYDALADCKSQSNEEILALFLDALDRRSELAESARLALARGLDRLQLYEAAVETLLRQRHAGHG